MIFDTLEHSQLYVKLGERIACALDFLARPQSARLEPTEIGAANSLRHPIQGDDIFALVQRYQTRPPAETFWEAHRRYIDVQCVMEGVEFMAHANLNSMRVIQAYDDEKDYMKLELKSHVESSTLVRVEAGSLAIFMPRDAHMPGLMADGVCSMVKKIVVKVKANVNDDA